MGHDGPWLAYLPGWSHLDPKLAAYNVGWSHLDSENVGAGVTNVARVRTFFVLLRGALLARKFVSDKTVRLSERRTVWREIFCAREARASERQYGHFGYAGNISTLSGLYYRSVVTPMLPCFHAIRQGPRGEISDSEPPRKNRIQRIIFWGLAWPALSKENTCPKLVF